MQDDEARFKKLRQRPFVAWPTVILMLVCLSVIVFSWLGWFFDFLPLWVGCIMNSIAMYYLFSPMHDAMHRAVSQKDWVNDAVQFVSTGAVAPYSYSNALRWMHMQHHRHTNDALDPDKPVCESLWHALLGWFFWEYWYFKYSFAHQEKLPAGMQAKAMVQFPLVVAILAGLFYLAPLAMLMLWFIPSRFMIWMIAAVFMYLPHYPHVVSQQQHPYQATMIREGWEWLLTPLLAYQNYHLVHHLYPTVPFYRYIKVWKAKQAAHEAQQPAKVSAFGLRPHNLHPEDYQ